MVTGERHLQARGLSTGRPRPHGQGQPLEARVISPDAGAPFRGRFLSSAGHRCCPPAASARSSRGVARATGRWTLCWTLGGRAWSQRLTWAGWYGTPNVRRITAATRLPVPTWPRKPYAWGSRASRTGSWARCSARSVGVGPGAGWRRTASTPSGRARLSHWLTAPGVTPSAAAIADCFQPGCASSLARRRRPSRPSSGVVGVLMSPAYHPFTHLYRRQ